MIVPNMHFTGKNLHCCDDWRRSTRTIFVRRASGGSGTFAHLYVYSTQFYNQMSNYSGTSYSETCSKGCRMCTVQNYTFSRGKAANNGCCHTVVGVGIRTRRRQKLISIWIFRNICFRTNFSFIMTAFSIKQIFFWVPRRWQVTSDNPA